MTDTGDRSSALDVVGLGIEHRSSTVQAVNKKKRLVDLLIVPWDEEADVEWRGEIWHETFDRRSFDGVESSAGRVQINREHRKGDTVGKIVQLDPKIHPDGLFGRAKMYPTERGDETLILAEEGGAFPSVGFYVKSFADMLINRRNKTRRILRGFIDHVAMVEDQAFTGAKVLAVRAGLSNLEAMQQLPLATPALDEFADDPVLAWASSRLDQRR